MNQSEMSFVLSHIEKERILDDEGLQFIKMFSEIIGDKAMHFAQENNLLREIFNKMESLYQDTLDKFDSNLTKLDKKVPFLNEIYAELKTVTTSKTQSSTGSDGVFSAAYKILVKIFGNTVGFLSKIKALNEEVATLQTSKNEFEKYKRENEGKMKKQQKTSDEKKEILSQ